MYEKNFVGMSLEIQFQSMLNYSSELFSFSGLFCDAPNKNVALLIILCDTESSLNVPDDTVWHWERQKVNCELIACNYVN